jgi:large subunit ribosomal protein L4
MATVRVQGVGGEVRRERELPAELFDAPVNVPVMHQVVVAGAAAQRAGTHSTKTRGEVSGGGVKPWRQKGTGRARQGSIRAPQWMGGGIAHGPKPRSYEMRVNKKMKRVALRSALSDASASGKLAVIDALAFDGPRTKDAMGVLAALELTGNVLLVLPRPDEVVEKSFRNLSQVRVAYPGNLSTYELLYADHVVFTDEALDVLTGESSGPFEPAEPEEPEEPEAEGDDETGETAIGTTEEEPDEGGETEVEP